MADKAGRVTNTPFVFNMHELAGSLGDFGTFIPLAIGYISICGINPSGMLVIMGLANIITGIIYRLPMPIQPMKVIAIVAITQHWPPEMVYAAAFGMGLIWLVLSLSDIMGFLGRITPAGVVKGIQGALGILLIYQALPFLTVGWGLSALAVCIILTLRHNRYVPAAVVLMGLGIVSMVMHHPFAPLHWDGFTWPVLTGFQPRQAWEALVQAGFAQVPLTATNAVIATSALISRYWPERKVSERQLALNMGIINLISPFWGGMPLCHGAGGLAGQYYFGARTGGTNIIEGLIELSLGLLLAGSLATILTAFPRPIIGAMLLLVGLEMLLFIDIKLDFKQDKTGLVAMVITILASLLGNMALGYVLGVLTYYGKKCFMKEHLWGKEG